MKIWTTKERIDIPYSKIEDRHLLNILKYIEKKSKEGITIMVGSVAGDEPDDWWSDKYKIYGKEVLKRLDYQGLLEEARNRKLKV